MAATDGTSPTLRLRTLLVLALVMTLLVAAFWVARNGWTGDESDRASGVADQEAAAALTSTRFRMATFNVLGASHTDGAGADKPAYASSSTRMGWTVREINNRGLSIVGFQEMQPIQYRQFRSHVGDNWGVWPGDALRDRDTPNSLGWDKSVWTALRKETVAIPYINGRLINMPLVTLEHKVTGNRITVMNVHNVADKFDNWRYLQAEAVRREIATMNREKADHPDIPVFLIGDFNDPSGAFCKVVAGTGMRASKGGYIEDGVCHPVLKPRTIDWLFAEAPASFTGWARLRDGLIPRITDHPVVTSDVSLPPRPLATTPVRRVIVLTVPGLRSWRVAAKAGSLPGFARLRERGAGTLNARTVPEQTRSLPNLLSIVSGRPVRLAIGGHGVGSDTPGATSVHAAAGTYVSSVFDLVHNGGRSTSLFTSQSSTTFVNRSWDADHGGADTTWTNQGTDKIDRFVLEPRNRRMMDRLIGSLRSSPSALTVAQLDAADRAGHTYGFNSGEYDAALARVDGQIDRVLDTVKASSRLRGQTLVVVVGEHGGVEKDHGDASDLANAKVPFFVWGPGVAPGADLYALNPGYTNPQDTVPGYSGGQPIRTGDVANLVLAWLRLRSIPGAPINSDEGLNARPLGFGS